MCPSWDFSHPDWVEGTFERDERRAREFDRWEDERLRELELVDLLRERGSSLSGRADIDRGGGLLGGNTAGPPVPGTPRPESDEKEKAA